MKIEVLTVGSLAVRCYLIICTQTGQAAIIDPGGEEERIINKLEELAVKPVYILATHGHPDHVCAAWEIRKRLKIPIAMHEEDDLFFRSPKANIVFQTWGFAPNEPADILLKDNDILEIGKIKLRVIHTPGHSPGSVCFYDQEKHLFTGDTLFVGAVGRTDLPGGDFQQMLKSIEEKILPLPGDTIILPGHDYGDHPYSTLTLEKETNPFIVEFILEKS